MRYRRIRIFERDGVGHILRHRFEIGATTAAIEFARTPWIAAKPARPRSVWKLKLDQERLSCAGSRGLALPAMSCTNSHCEHDSAHALGPKGSRDADTASAPVEPDGGARYVQRVHEIDDVFAHSGVDRIAAYRRKRKRVTIAADVGSDHPAPRGDEPRHDLVEASRSYGNPCINTTGSPGLRPAVLVSNFQGLGTGAFERGAWAVMIFICCA